jgi:hypothetical protein
MLQEINPRFRCFEILLESFWTLVDDLGQDNWPGMQRSCLKLILKFYSEKQEQDQT